MSLGHEPPSQDPADSGMITASTHLKFTKEEDPSGEDMEFLRCTTCSWNPYIPLACVTSRGPEKEEL